MVVKFNSVQKVKQDGLYQECMFVECKRINFYRTGIANIFFSEKFNDYYSVSIDYIDSIE